MMYASIALRQVSRKRKALAARERAIAELQSKRERENRPQLVSHFDENSWSWRVGEIKTKPAEPGITLDPAKTKATTTEGN